MQHSQIHDDRVALARKITGLVELYPGIVTSYDDVRLRFRPVRTWPALGRRRDNDETIEMILSFQDGFERLARKEEFDRNDLNVINQRLSEMKTAAWMEPTERSHDFSGSLMPRFSSDSWINVQGRYDTTSETSCISMSLLKSAGYYPNAEIVACPEKPFTFINGQQKPVLGKIRVIWRPGPKREQRQTLFLVLETLGFGVVIGNGLVEDYAKVATDHLIQDIQHGIATERTGADQLRHTKSSGSNTSNTSPLSPPTSHIDRSRTSGENSEDEPTTPIRSPGRPRPFPPGQRPQVPNKSPSLTNGRRA